MNKYLLLIDDKEEFKKDFQVIAQREGYGLAWKKSYEDMVDVLPALSNKITAIILDIKCLITNEQEIENEDFIGKALTLLNQNYPDIPRLILTGDDEAFNGLKKYFSNEEIYKKEPSDILRLFNRINEHQKYFSTRILNFREKEILSIIEIGEGKNLEFKSSLQFCVKTQTENKDLRFEVLKNLAAFANTDGGTLLLGVQDDKTIIGLENTDYLTLKKDDKQDELRLLIDSLIESKFGNDFHSVLENIKFYNVHGKTVCKLVIKNKFSKPTFILKKAINTKPYDAFFIRAQASARELNDLEKNSYLKSNWD